METGDSASQKEAENRRNFMGVEVSTADCRIHDSEKNRKQPK
jgi:hypothetical protein